MRLSKYWDIEDIFFGALFGSVFGIYVSEFPFPYTILLVGFFVIFPSAIRKASRMADTVIKWVAFISAVWLAVFFLDLWNNSIISTPEWLVAFSIFAGWVFSVFFRVRR